MPIANPLVSLVLMVMVLKGDKKLGIVRIKCVFRSNIICRRDVLVDSA